MIAFTDDDAEMQKRLGACLIAGDTIISIDNVDKDLSSSFLCQCLTQDIVKPRILGKSEQPDISPNAVYFTTGNNLRLADDLAARRTIRGALDAKCERPDLRIFETPDPIVVLRRERPQYLAAALTVLRAYVVANTPRRPGPTGSFDEWSNWVRAALIWLDQADPWATIETVRRLDSKRDALIAVVTEWSRAIGIVEELTVRQLIDRVTDFVPTQGVNLNPLRREFVFPEFREALLAVAGKSGAIDGYRLGNWLAHQKGKEVNGLYVGSGVGQATWKLYKR